MAKWFVSYSWAGRLGHGFGNTSIIADGYLSDMEDINRVQTVIEEKNGYDTCIILSFQRFEDAPAP